MSNDGNVRVCVRFRPQNKLELEEGGGEAVELNGDELRVTDEGGHPAGQWKFDRVFGPTSGQHDVYDFVAKPLVRELLEGFNCTILAYGQTGSGKTHTMLGVLPSEEDMDLQMSGGALPEDDMRGVIPRIIGDIFTTMLAAPSSTEFTVRASYLELYLERVNDLLNPALQNLKVRENPTRGVYVEGITEVYVENCQEMLRLMSEGNSNRAVSSTRMNADSSRSHSVFLVSTEQKDTLTGMKKAGQMFLVDLAGSEMVGKTHASGQTLEEAKMINKSLSALGNVIKALIGGTSHVPYRDSKLTRVLQDSLGGNAKTSLIIACSMSLYNVDETISTLRFGARAKCIKNKPQANQERSPEEYKRLLQAAEKKEKQLLRYVRALEAEIGQLRNGEDVPDSVVHPNSGMPALPVEAAQSVAKDQPPSSPASSFGADEAKASLPPVPSPNAPAPGVTHTASPSKVKRTPRGDESKAPAFISPPRIVDDDPFPSQQPDPAAAPLPAAAADTATSSAARVGRTVDLSPVADLVESSPAPPAGSDGDVAPAEELVGSLYDLVTELDFGSGSNTVDAVEPETTAPRSAASFENFLRKVLGEQRRSYQDACEARDEAESELVFVREKQRDGEAQVGELTSRLQSMQRQIELLEQQQQGNEALRSNQQEFLKISQVMMMKDSGPTPSSGRKKRRSRSSTTGSEHGDEEAVSVNSRRSSRSRKTPSPGAGAEPPGYEETMASPGSAVAASLHAVSQKLDEEDEHKLAGELAVERPEEYDLTDSDSSGAESDFGDLELDVAFIREQIGETNKSVREEELATSLGRLLRNRRKLAARIAELEGSVSKKTTAHSVLAAEGESEVEGGEGSGAGEAESSTALESLVTELQHRMRDMMLREENMLDKHIAMKKKEKMQHDHIQMLYETLEAFNTTQCSLIAAHHERESKLEAELGNLKAVFGSLNKVMNNNGPAGGEDSPARPSRRASLPGSIGAPRIMKPKQIRGGGRGSVTRRSSFRGMFPSTPADASSPTADVESPSSDSVEGSPAASWSAVKQASSFRRGLSAGMGRLASAMTPKQQDGAEFSFDLTPKAFLFGEDTAPKKGSGSGDLGT